MRRINRLLDQTGERNETIVLIIYQTILLQMPDYLKLKSFAVLTGKRQKQ